MSSPARAAAGPQTRPETAPILPGVGLPDLFRDLNDAVVLAGPDRCIQWMNRAAEEMFGYTLAEVTGSSTRVFYADEEAFHLQGRQRYSPAASSDSFRFEVAYRRKDGSLFPSQTTGSPVRDSSGGVAGYLAIIKDVTEPQAVENILRALYDISSSHDLDSGEKIRRILRLGLKRFRTATGIVSWIREDTYTVLMSVSELTELEPGTEFPLGDTYCSHTLQADQPLALHQAGRSSLGAHPCYSVFRLETYIGVPLIVDGSRFGTLNFTCAEEREPFSTADLELIKLFAAWIAQELSVQNTIAKLTEAARRDPMTGCLNRRTWFDSAAAVLDGTAGGSVVLMDLDWFKSVNDRHGHPAGDAVLRSAGRLLQELSPDGAIPGRIGGEEFALFLPQASPDEARGTAERLRAAIAGIRFGEDAAGVRITASFGIARADAAEGLRQAYADADTALYDAKARGRNRVCG